MVVVVYQRPDDASHEVPVANMTYDNTIMVTEIDRPYVVDVMLTVDYTKRFGQFHEAYNKHTIYTEINFYLISHDPK